MKKKSQKPRSSRLIPWLFALSLVAHVVLYLTVGRHARTSMWFNLEQEEQRAAMVQDRELARKLAEKERRQSLKLPKEHAESLKRQAEEKPREILRDNVAKLRQSRDKLVREQEEALEKLRERSLEDVLPHQVERLSEDLRKMFAAAHEVTRSNPGEEAEEFKKELQKQRDDFAELKKKADEGELKKEAFEEKAGELAEVLKPMEEQYREWQNEHGGATSHRAMEAKFNADSLGQKAEEIADGLDLDKLNEIPDALVIDAPPAGTDPEHLADLDSADLYDAALELERQANQAQQQARAAEVAVAQGSTIEDALKRVQTGAPQRPDLADQLRPGGGETGEASSHTAANEGKAGENQSGGAASETANNENQSGGAASETATSEGGSGTPGTVGELNEFREAMRQAVTETTDMRRRASRASSSAGSLQSRPAQSRVATTARQRALEERSRQGGQGKIVNMTSLQLAANSGMRGLESGGIGGDAGFGLAGDTSGRGGEMARGVERGTVRLPTSKVVANALPGRMLTRDSSRAGYLYLDTWYIVGPWDNWSRADFELVHAPELEVNLDAVFHDGKFAGQANHPYHELRWEFVQSDRIAIQPPFPHYSATYYAYTEVYSDETREMLVAVGSDDMAKMWLNGEPVWTDEGQSSWNLDEGFRRVIFSKGFNTVLVRFENGPAYVAFSVLLVPPEVVAGADK